MHNPTVKRVLIGLGLLLLLLIVVEVVGLLRMKASVKTYANYWNQRSKQSGELTYVALGDSAAQSIGASKPQEGYVGLLADRLQAATGKKVRVINLSVTGARIRDVTTRQLPQLAQYQPDIVTIEVGANDVVDFNEAAFRQDFAGLVKALPAHTYVADMPYFGGRLYTRERFARTASGIVANNLKNTDLRPVALHRVTEERKSIFNNSYDLFHPSDRSYKNWADAFWQAMKNQLP